MIVLFYWIISISSKWTILFQTTVFSGHTYQATWRRRQSWLWRFASKKTSRFSFTKTKHSTRLVKIGTVEIESYKESTFFLSFKRNK